MFAWNQFTPTFSPNKGKAAVKWIHMDGNNKDKEKGSNSIPCAALRV